MIRLRKITLQDLDWILDIVNQPSARKASFYGKRITIKGHIKHWKERLKSIKALAIIYNNTPIGVIKVFKDRSVFIVVDEKYRRRGIAYNSLRRVNFKRAEIKPNNTASLNLFRKLGLSKVSVIMKRCRITRL